MMKVMLHLQQPVSPTVGPPTRPFEEICDLLQGIFPHAALSSLVQFKGKLTVRIQIGFKALTRQDGSKSFVQEHTRVVLRHETLHLLISLSP